jgi:hypothetical protein
MSLVGTQRLYVGLKFCGSDVCPVDGFVGVYYTPKWKLIHAGGTTMTYRTHQSL